MKIGLIVPGGFYPGGRERSVPALQDLAGELAARHEVHVFAAGSDTRLPRYTLAGAEVHDCGLPPFAGGASAARAGRLAWRLAREVRRVSATGRFDVLHAFWLHDTAVLAGLLGRALGVPVVVSVGGGETVWLPDLRYGGARSLAGRARVRAALRLAGAVTAGSPFARALLGPRDARRAEVIPLGVSAARFSPPDTRPAGPPWRLLHVASLNPVKDQETLLRAFARVRASGGAAGDAADVSLDCIGEDTLGGRIQRLARDLGVDGQVRFHGFVPQAELAAFYRAAHLHVMSSRHESQGVVVLEAAATGLPTVGTAVGILPALAALAPPAAACVPPGDPGALASALASLLADGARRASMGEEARRYAAAHDLAWTARAMEDLYRSLAA